MKARVSIGVLVIALAGCGDGGVIYDKDPFYKARFEFLDEKSSLFIEESKKFAAQRKMEIAVNQNQFRENDFNILIYDKGINIISSTVVEKGKVRIDAISRTEPKNSQVRLVENYVHALRPFLGRSLSPLEETGPSK